jgi:AAA+ ATPase superfamily predicted ATPase
LRRDVDNAGRLFLYAERRMGKTSMMRVLLNDLSEEEYVAAT